MSDSPTRFQQDKYLILQQCAPKVLLKAVTDYLWFRQKTGGLSFENDRVADRLHREPILDVVLDYFGIVIRHATGLDLVPTYSFARIYYQGAALPRHVDRPSCEVSCTLPLACTDGPQWPIFVAVDAEDEHGRGVELEVGDMLVYRGEQVWHWREPLEKPWQAQIFLHYVERQGKNAQWQYDKRGKLSMSLAQLDMADEQAIAGELQTHEIAEELADLLQKQLGMLKALHLAKKLALPVLLAAAAVAGYLIYK